MLPVNGIRLFKIFGITVYLHWSWIIMAVYMIQVRQNEYHHAIGWNIAEYLAIFAIVLLHEFGHALACRSVGGRAERIVLWPLGGVAYVNPPQRPGATLWSIVAGPLVNVVLLPVTFALPHLFPSAGANIHHFLESVAWINLMLLVFNILPVYPLDGGQILRSLLWFVIGRANSLVAASVVGMVGAIGFGLFALSEGSWWLGLIAVFAVMQCLAGFAQARVLRQRAALPRRANAACPACKQAPPVGTWWLCAQCHAPFDTFATGSLCPYCARADAQTSCPECGVASPYTDWLLYPAPPLEAAPQAPWQPGYTPLPHST